ncbi:molybdate ABC transporter substrate-binding protein [Endozoicomonas sp. ALD040]|uniref:molybdate ABC transporter substrate-binding protein n=1 Tax=unclassified Endozoicomonas TaxID=2644528 RepID=UPI003BB10225
MFHFRFVRHPKSFSKLKAIPDLPILTFIFGCLLTITPLSEADTIKVAVAASFQHVLESLKGQFQSRYGHTLELYYGTSQDLRYRVSDNTQKFDLFLSADNLKTAELEQMNKILANSRKIYAQGLLAFWHGQRSPLKPNDIKTYLIDNNPPTIHIADREAAPYRHAAVSVLQKYYLYRIIRDQDRLSYNDHVRETWTNIKNSSDAGFAPFSQVKEVDFNSILFPVSVTLVPQSLYTPLLQELVILKATEHEAAAKTLVEYLLSDETQRFIGYNGYQRAAAKKQDLNLVPSPAVSLHKRESRYPKAALVIVWLNTAMWMLSGA